MRTQEVFTVPGFSILGRIRKRQAVFQVKIRPRLFLRGLSQEQPDAPTFLEGRSLSPQ